MKISLLTDAPKYNLALMKISAYHKAQGDEVMLNSPLFPADKTYASVLFDWNKNKFMADKYGGPQFPKTILPQYIEELRPDYDLYKLDHSLGYTFRPCYRKCDFCLVKTFRQPDKNHHSIWEFHEKKFKDICLLNNNTFLDRFWEETFKEIWDADLRLMEHGFDVRVLDDKKAEALKKTRFRGRLHFAWDRMKDEEVIVKKLNLLKEYEIIARFYVLIGYDTTIEQDLHRCQVLINYDQVPYVMPYTKKPIVKKFKNFMNSPAHWWHRRDKIHYAWDNYCAGIKTKAPDLKQESLFNL